MYIYAYVHMVEKYIPNNNYVCIINACTYIHSYMVEKYQIIMYNMCVAMYIRTYMVEIVFLYHVRTYNYGSINISLPCMYVHTLVY